jgi:hypothetical protein
MIKLNLLPAYVIEVRRIRVTVIVFVILLALEGGVVFKANADLQAQEKWFGDDKTYYVGRKATIEKAKTEADAVEAKSKAYTALIDFFKRGAVQEYNTKLAASMQEVAAAIGPHSTSWYNEILLEKNSFTLTGHVKGLMNFVSLYFKMKDAGLTITPRAPEAWETELWQKNNKEEILAAPTAYPKPMSQWIAIKVAGTLKAELPAPPTPPEGMVPWTQLAQPPAAAAPAEGAPAEGAPPAAPPAAAPTPAP